MWNRSVLIVGVSRTGKTTTMLKMMKKYYKDHMMVFINTKREQKWDKYCRYINPSLELFQYMVGNHEKFTDGIIEVYMPSILDENPIEYLEQFIKIIMEAHQENNFLKTVIAIDELHEFQSKMSVNKAIKRIASMGMGLGLFGIFCSQRWTDVHNDLITNAEIRICHALDLHDFEQTIRWMNFEKMFEDLGIEKPINAKDISILFPQELDSDGRMISHRAYLQTNKVEGAKMLW